jgi:5-methyltetrahydrofolate--homocysteine methyltransferase
MQRTLEFKPDFERARWFWTNFWQGKADRPAICIILPRPGTRSQPTPAYLDCFDGDFHRIADQLLAWAETHEFLAESIPYYYLEFGPDTFAAWLGAGLQLAPDRRTSWSVPCVEDWDETEVRFHPEGYWWQRTVEAAGVLLERCGGKILICPPTLVANLDALSALRGPQRLMIDLAVCPEKVQRALGQVNAAHTQIMAACARAFQFDRYGSMNVEGAYTTGTQSRPQCDASCMISPAMFRELVAPCLESEADDADAFVYHLDGPGAIKHLEALCGIPKLDMIAWVHGAGDEDKDWSALYDRIDRLGKGQWHYVTGREQIKQAWHKYTSRKLAFTISAESASEVEDFLGELEQIEKDGADPSSEAADSRQR